MMNEEENYENYEENYNEENFAEDSEDGEENSFDQQARKQTEREVIEAWTREMNDREKYSELDIFIIKTNTYLAAEYCTVVNPNGNNVIFNIYFESFSRNETFQHCAGRLNEFLVQNKIKPEAWT